MSDETNAIRRELRVLKLYAAFSTLGFGILALAAFRQAPQKARFSEIDVERINVVEPNGMYRMVISNRPRSIGPIYKGKPFGYEGGGRPGIIFFNDEGTENGGLTFTGATDSTGKYAASSHFSFDQFNQDQIFYFDYVDNNGRKRTGLTIADRAPVDIRDLVALADSVRKLYPDRARQEAELSKLYAAKAGDVPMFATRAFLGRAVDKSAMLMLTDPMGRPRIRLRVDSLGAAGLEFLDEKAAVVARFPQGAR